MCPVKVVFLFFSDDFAFIGHIHYCQFICALEVVKRNLQKATCAVGPAELQTLLYNTPCSNGSIYLCFIFPRIQNKPRKTMHNHV